MSKFVKYLSIFLLAFSLVLGVTVFLNPSDRMIDFVLYYTYILFGLAVLLVIVLPVIGMVSNPKNVKRMIVNFGAVIVVFGLGFLLASGDPLPTITTAIPPTAFALKLSDAGLIIAYILIAASVLSIVSGVIINLVRNR